MATHASQFDFLLAGLRDPDTDLPLAGGTVYFYEVGTTTAKNVWTEVDKTNAFTSITLDSQGMAEVFGDGAYKIVVKDSTGATEFTFDVVKVADLNSNSRSLSATGTATPDDDILLCSGTFTLNLQTVANFTRPLMIKRVSGTITVDPYGSETIDGAATVELNATDDSLFLFPDVSGVVWYRSNRLAGLTASVAQINAKCAAETFASNANKNPNISDTQFDVHSSVAEDAWESIGPSATGDNPADNAWPQLSAAVGADWIEVAIFISGITTSYSAHQAQYTNIFARATGGAQTESQGNKIAGIGSLTNAAGLSRLICSFTRKIPIDAYGRFDIFWETSYQYSTLITLILTGYGYNP